MSSRRSESRRAREQGLDASGSQPPPVGPGRNRRRRATAAAAALALLALAVGCEPEPSPWRSSAIAKGMACCQSPSWVPRFSADGSTLVFMSLDGTWSTATPTARSDVFARDMATGDTTLVSVDAAGTGAGAGHSYLLGISDDGTKVLFASGAADLVAGDANGARTCSSATSRPARPPPCRSHQAGAPGNGGSRTAPCRPTGPRSAILSYATDLVPGVDDGGSGGGDVYVRDLAHGTTTLASVTAAGRATGGTENISISPDGSKVAFEGDGQRFGPTDTNQRDDVYLRDLAAGTTTLVSANAAGTDAGNNDSIQRQA